MGVQTKVCVPVQSGLVELGVANHVSCILYFSHFFSYSIFISCMEAYGVLLRCRELMKGVRQLQATHDEVDDLSPQ